MKECEQALTERIKKWVAARQTEHTNRYCQREQKIITDWVEKNDAHKNKVEIIAVGGTNGKGSTQAVLAGIYQRAGYRVGCFTSPHIMRMNERICVNGEEISDEDFIEACQYFLNNPKFDDLGFFSILLLVFMRYALEKGVDMMICEVGLGGRLDSVNALPITSGIISSIGWDHMDVLGHSLEEIALEKVAICRSGQPLIVAGPMIPEEALKFLHKEKAAVFIYGKDYALEDGPLNWVWRYRDCEIKLAKSQLHPQTVGGALMLVKVLEKKFPVSEHDIVRAIENVNLPGRMECICDDRNIWVDIAHNEPAVKNLMSNWPFSWENTVCIIQFKKTKDWKAMLKAILSYTKNIWVIGDDLQPMQLGLKSVTDQALPGVKEKPCGDGDMVSPEVLLDYANLPMSRCLKIKKTSRVFEQKGRKLVFGSFLAVAKVKAVFQK